MDYYSNFPMPEFEIRKQNLINYSKTLIHSLPEPELEQIINTIISESVVY